MAKSQDTDIIDHTADERAPPAERARTPAAPLNAEERIRLQELRQQAASVNEQQGMPDNDRRLLEELEYRAAPQSAASADRLQRGLAPNMPVQTPRPLPAEDANRLRDLRVAHSFGRLNDSEKSEMDDLGRREAELAGHVVAEPEPDWTRDSDGMMRVDAEIVSIIEGIVDQVPALHGLRPRLARLTGRLRAFRSETAPPPPPPERK